MDGVSCTCPIVNFACLYSINVYDNTELVFPIMVCLIQGSKWKSRSNPFENLMSTISSWLTVIKNSYKYFKKNGLHEFHENLVANSPNFTKMILSKVNTNWENDTKFLKEWAMVSIKGKPFQLCMNQSDMRVSTRSVTIGNRTQFVNLQKRLLFCYLRRPWKHFAVSWDTWNTYVGPTISDVDG